MEFGFYRGVFGVCVTSETSFENAAQETSPEACHTVSSQELHNDLTHYYNVPGVSDRTPLTPHCF